MPRAFIWDFLILVAGAALLSAGMLRGHLPLMVAGLVPHIWAGKKLFSESTLYG